MELYLINLDRSPERLRLFEVRNSHVAPFHRFAAVDGSTIDRRNLIERGLFAPAVSYTDGAIGVALSHLALWDIAISKDEPITVIEDDAVFHHQFRSESERLLAQTDPDWHIFFWGYNFDSPVVLEWMSPSPLSCVISFRQDEIRAGLHSYPTTKVRPERFKVAEVCGLVCYSVSPAGARMLKNFCFPVREMLIRFEGLNRTVPNFAIDVMMNAIFRRMNVYACFPPLVVTPNDKQTSLTVGSDRILSR